MNIKKSVFLFLALLLPIVTFLFLKFFGKNEFEVKPLFQTTVRASEECKGIEYTVPYTIPDTVLSNVQRGVSDSVTLVVFQDAGIANQQEQAIQLTRIFKEFNNQQMSIVKIERDDGSESRLTGPKSGVLLLEDVTYKRFRNCVFLMDTLRDAVVIDKGNRIRGQYVMSNREDADRLIVELKILLKKY